MRWVCDAVVIWIGTNDVLQGEAAGAVVERIVQVAREKARVGKRKVEMAFGRGRIAERPAPLRGEMAEKYKKVCKVIKISAKIFIFQK